MTTATTVASPAPSAIDSIHDSFSSASAEVYAPMPKKAEVASDR